jgi:hypothetical protein
MDEVSCDDIANSVKYMKKRKIKSNLAMFYILMACKTESSKYGYEKKLKSISTRWLDEVKKMEEIERLNDFESKIDRNVYFATNVLFNLQFEKGNNINKCPYTDKAKNFIQTILETNQCLCLCYTNYVLAAAQEFDYDLIYGCNVHGHIYIVIIDDSKKYKEETMTKEVKLWGDITFDMSIKVDDKFFFPKIHTSLESGYYSNNKIIVETTLVRNFDKYIVDKKNFFNVHKHGKSEYGKEKICKLINVDKNFKDDEWSIIAGIVHELPIKEKINRERYEYFIDVINELWGDFFSELKTLYGLSVERKNLKKKKEKEKNTEKIINSVNEFSKVLGGRIKEDDDPHPGPNLFLKFLQSLSEYAKNNKPKRPASPSPKRPASPPPKRSTNERKIIVGPKGGKYYINDKGGKNYI